MADFAQHLPLSQRRSGDESGVSSDRRAAIADLIDEAARLLAASETRAHAARRFLTDAALRLDTDDLADAATAVRTGRRRRIRDLSRTLRALLTLADALGAQSSVAPVTTGAVALYAATSAPFDRRAVIRGHTVRATDQDWAFGHGPILEGTADTILRFLLALSDDPPRRPPATSAAAATVEE